MSWFSNAPRRPASAREWPRPSPCSSRCGRTSTCCRRAEFAQSHVDGHVRIYDYETGAEKGDVHLKAIATDILTVDINGDGRMKFVMGTNDGGVIVIKGKGNDLASRVVYETDSAMGSPIAADLDGDGISEIYVVSGDGNLH